MIFIYFWLNFSTASTKKKEVKSNMNCTKGFFWIFVQKSTFLEENELEVVIFKC
jgi:hypothetical protein